jgi:hypothetical protein
MSCRPRGGRRSDSAEPRDRARLRRVEVSSRVLSDSWTYGRVGLEGLVAERLDSIYRPGERSRNWVKAKCPDWRVHHAPRRLREDRRTIAK